MTGMLGALTVVAVAKVERQAFAAVPVVEYDDLEDCREPSRYWITRARAAQAPPVYLLAFAHVLSLVAATASRASSFGGK